MAVLNGSVIVTMWRGRMMRQMLTRQQQREQSTTVMLLIVTIVFAVCNTLPFLLNVVESVFPDLFVDPVSLQRVSLKKTTSSMSRVAFLRRKSKGLSRKWPKL
ncbi:hypothetical protein OESDEN_14245 [Oesophagostomum dentatum]|uniref:G-protein coupled receptors family 1 profile domain-containing protein n=1 Tax=Oesophagostomum dentatum TaxID=61180 RepID=A0A0B1SR78_OESDE|nr:hypothetical protein OESDEN_14245 [Oesophagostomum dentatum]